MTNLALALWAADALGTLRNLFLVSGVVSTLGLALIAVIWIVVVNEDRKQDHPFVYPPKLIIRLLIAAPFMAITGAILPTDTTVKQMIGVTYAEKLITDPRISGLADPASQLVKEYLEQQLSALRAKKTQGGRND